MTVAGEKSVLEAQVEVPGLRGCYLISFSPTSKRLTGTDTSQKKSHKTGKQFNLSTFHSKAEEVQGCPLGTKPAFNQRGPFHVLPRRTTSWDHFNGKKNRAQENIRQFINLPENTAYFRADHSFHSQVNVP